MSVFPAIFLFRWKGCFVLWLNFQWQFSIWKLKMWYKYKTILYVLSSNISQLPCLLVLDYYIFSEAPSHCFFLYGNPPRNHLPVFISAMNVHLTERERISTLMDAMRSRLWSTHASTLLADEVPYEQSDYCSGPSTTMSGLRYIFQVKHRWSAKHSFVRGFVISLMSTLHNGSYERDNGVSVWLLMSSLPLLRGKQFLFSK